MLRKKKQLIPWGWGWIHHNGEVRPLLHLETTEEKTQGREGVEGEAAEFFQRGGWASKIPEMMPSGFTFGTETNIKHDFSGTNSGSVGGLRTHPLGRGWVRRR